MISSPVQIHAEHPARYDRAQLVLRLLLILALCAIGIPPWPFGLLYLALPLLAAVLLTVQGTPQFLAEGAPPLARGLGWLLALLGYFMLLTDKLPGRRETPIDVRIEVGGRPTVATALVRLVTSIPSAVALFLLGCISIVVLIVAAVFVLATTRVPRGLWELQLAVLRWHGRLFAYHASLVDAYPPFVVDTSHPEPPHEGERPAIVHS